ncbi:MAG: folate-binding protein YgfZ [Rhodospirillaceae bacterium]|nr:folate-binding protein YgfZ [Rhodospirillaceae bacterium]
MTGYHIAEDRTVLRVSGADRVEFLQGIVSNDVAKAGRDRGVWAAFLTPQGKYLHDFFLAADGESILLDCERARADDLRKRLRRYTLRSDARVEAADDLAVALSGADSRPAPEGVACFADPRHGDAGFRAIGEPAAVREAMAAAGLAPADPLDWDCRRLALGLPDGSRDLEVERSTLAEANADLLGGIDWEKGCWMGQEVTARMHYRGLAKRRLTPMRVDGPMPPRGATVERDGKPVGECRSSAGDLVMVLARTEAIDEAEPGLRSGAARLYPAPPGWLKTALKQDAAASGAR